MDIRLVKKNIFEEKSWEEELMRVGAPLRYQVNANYDIILILSS